MSGSYPTWLACILCALLSADGFKENRCDVPRLHASMVDQLQFDTTYRNRNMVILQHAFEDWRANSNWTYNEIIRAFGNMSMKVQKADVNDPNKLQYWVSLAEYLTSDAHQDLFAISFGSWKHFRRILADVWPIPPLLQSVMKEPIFSIGLKGTGPDVHSHKENWMAQVKGRKAWILAPKSVLFGGFAFSDFIPENSCDLVYNNNEALPNGFQVCIVEPGELIYLPDKTLHGTCNLDFSVGVGGREEGQPYPPEQENIYMCNEMRLLDDIAAADGAIQRDSGLELLKASISAQCTTATKLLLDRGADIDAGRDQGYSALLHATEQGTWHEGVELLLSRGAYTQMEARRATADNPGPDGRAPVHWAVESANVRMLEHLLDYRAGLDLEWSDMSALQRIGFYGHTGMLELLHRRGVDLNPLLSLASSAISDYLIELGVEEGEAPETHQEETEGDVDDGRNVDEDGSDDDIDDGDDADEILNHAPRGKKDTHDPFKQEL